MTDIAAPRWAVRTARLTALTTLPSCLWRAALGVGIPVGFHGELLHRFAGTVPGWGTVYAFVLGGVAETLACLTLGLVRPWGRTLATWVPLLGGRRIPPLAAALPAALGAAAVTLITWSAVFAWNNPAAMGDPDAPHGLAGLIMTACYAPLLAWGPLLAVVTADFWRRTRPSGVSLGRDLQLNG